MPVHRKDTQLCISVGKHSLTLTPYIDSYTTIHTRDINTLDLVIMIRTEAQSTLGIIMHFSSVLSQGQKTPKTE